MPPSAPRLVIFDCDGVLIDSEIIAAKAQSQALAEHGIAITPQEAARRFAGIPDADMWRTLQQENGRSLPPGFAGSYARRLDDTIRRGAADSQRLALAAHARMHPAHDLLVVLGDLPLLMPRGAGPGARLAGQAAGSRTHAARRGGRARHPVADVVALRGVGAPAAAGLRHPEVDAAASRQRGAVP
ncbi:HAD hydrolase-like protein [Achromobacter sp. DMS1]|uniref:HAD hydrolase-like protein n=1 Tax=Achromobacter sp. DMS1 TaxID=1688405 RepID=UPI000AD2E971|nr:HAD hydrolase-like protein [Achromobacter sp. DMS1]